MIFNRRLLIITLLLPSVFLTACQAFPQELQPTLNQPWVGRVLSEFGPKGIVFARILLVGGGLAFLTAGWKIYRYAITIPGMIVGGLIGAALGMNAGNANGMLLVVIGFLVGAGVGAGISLTLHDIAVFLIGSTVGFAFVMNLVGDMEMFLSGIIAGLAIGTALLATSRLWVTVLASVIGSAMFGFGTGLTGTWFLLFFFGGLLIQYGLAALIGENSFAVSSKGKKKPKEERTSTVKVINKESAQGEKLRTETASHEVLPPAKTAHPIPTGENPEVLKSARLICLSGPFQNGVFAITQDHFLIGRGLDCQLQIPDTNVSRRHAFLRYVNGTWFIQDQESKEGTYVNDSQVVAMRLNPGDVFSIGDSTFRIDF